MCILTTGLFYCVILSKFSQQSLWAALHYHSHVYGARLLSKQTRNTFPKCHEAQCGVFQPKKVDQESQLGSQRMVAKPGVLFGKETHLEGRAYLCVSGFVKPLQLVYRLLKGLLTRMWKDKLICICTRTLFGKQSGNQVCAHSWPTTGCGRLV